MRFPYQAMRSLFGESFQKMNSTLPIIMVEIPPVHHIQSGYAYLREVQRAVADSDNFTHIVISNDLGPGDENRDCIHPPVKYDVSPSDRASAADDNDSVLYTIDGERVSDYLFSSTKEEEENEDEICKWID